jgi:hypothetical protein
MLLEEIIPLYSDIHTKHIRTLYEQNRVLLAAVTYSNIGTF